MFLYRIFNTMLIIILHVATVYVDVINFRYDEYIPIKFTEICVECIFDVYGRLHKITSIIFI